MPSLSGLPERFAGPDRYPLAPSVDGLEDPSLSSEERPHSSALPVLLPERSRAKPPAPSAAARDRHGQLSPDEAQCTAGMTHPRSGFAAPPQGGDTGGPAEPDPRCPLGGAAVTH